jgi:type II secretory pathway pseudopilin PulG
MRVVLPPHAHGQAAFTLIELMIAISLGIVILLTVMSGFRVASQSVSIVNRLSTENQLMRLGVERAHEYLDFWEDYDDPDNPSNQPLRGNDSGGGLPFTPMNAVSPYKPASSNSELTTGWDAEEHWPMSDPRVWWHGNVAEKDNSNVMLGRYALFANTAPSLNVISSTSTYGRVSVLHSWLYNQIWIMHNAIGYYGYLDYLPANTMFECYMPYSSGGTARTNDDGEPILLDTPGGAFASTEGPQHYPHGQYRLTMGAAMALTTPFALTPLNASQQQPGAHNPGLTNPANGPSTNKSSYFQQYYYVDYGYNANIFKQFLLDTTNATGLITGQILPPVAIPGQPGTPSDGPETWPNVRVTIQRFIKTNRFVNVCKVVCVSPLTGQTTQLVWDGFGTTLRGARLQRLQNTGWVTWDDPQIIPPARAANFHSLDEP